MKKNEIDLDPIFQVVREELSNKKKNCLQFSFGRRIISPLSTVVFFTISDGNNVQNLILKKTVPSKWDRLSEESPIKAEYDALKFLYPKFIEKNGCLVPKPVLFLPQHETIIMEGYNFPSLDENIIYLKFFTSNHSFEMLVEKFEKIGIWLKHLWEFSNKKVIKGEILSSIIQECDQRLTELEMSVPEIIPVGLHKKIIDYLEDLIQTISKEEMPVCGVHGDFGTHNILSSYEGIIVLDFSSFHESIVCYDSINILLSLENRSRSPIQSKRRIRKLMDAFWNGYGEKPEIPKELSVICELQCRLRSLCNMVFPESDLKWDRPFIRKKIARSHLHWLYDTENRKYLW